MSFSQFNRILISYFLVNLIAHSLFYLQDFKNILQSSQYELAYALSIYAIEIFIIYRLLGSNKSWVLAPFTGKSVLHSIIGIIAVTCLTNSLLMFLSDYSPILISAKIAKSYLLIFMLNTLPGAIIEEWLFRYLPLRLSLQMNRRSHITLLFVASLIVFAIVHIPTYLLYSNLPLNNLQGVFLRSIFFLWVYLFTRNLPFTALVHAQTNNPLKLVDSPYFWLYFYSTVILISSAWAYINWKRRSYREVHTVK